jgi:shikimate dehydrogenase
MIVIGLQMFLNKTVTGRAMQAVAQNTDAAKVLGINVKRMVLYTFLINAVLAVVAALLVTPTYLAKFDMGDSIGLKAFYAAIIGGFNQTRGALVTMPHKVTTVPLLDDCGTSVSVAGSCNAVLRRTDGTLYGELFDGAGFVRGVERKGFVLDGTRCLVVGTGGVGSAIAAALAAANIATLALFDTYAAARDALRDRLRKHYPKLDVRTDTRDPAGFDLVVNATPLGMNADDPLPIDVTRLAPSTFVGEVVMKQEITPLLRAARERGCPIQVGTDMLFEQIPLYLEFFGFGSVTPDELRAVAMLA